MRLLFIGVFALVIFSNLNISSVETEELESKELPQKSLFLTQKELPMDFTLTLEENGLKQANTEELLLSQTTTSKAYKEMEVEATAYVSYCDTGCIGITYTGTDVSDTILHSNGMGIIAVDPTVIPLGSIVEIDGKKYIADDTGGAIKGNRIDILMDTHDTTEAFKFGRQTITIKVLQ